MRSLTAFIGFILVASLCDAAVVQKRTYRNTEEILVPVTIIQDGEEIKQSPDLKENLNVQETKSLQSEVIAEDIAKAVDEEQKLEAVEAVVQAQRRIDEAIVEEEIKEAVLEEQNKEIVQALEEDNKLRTTLAEIPQVVSVIQAENPDALKEPVKELDEAEKSLDFKSVAVEKVVPNQVIVIEEANSPVDNDGAEQPEGTVRQATQATPAQTTTQQNFVQQLIQNSPLGQFFNQITGQTAQVASDETVPAPTPTLPGLFNPVTAVQNAAQSVVNSTTQAFQGLQQFASNLGNQFQNTLSGLGGQQQQDEAVNDGSTARPPGPIQQLVSTFIGTTQQTQPAPTQPGPLQGLLNIFQGNNRPQAATASTNSQPQPAKEPEIQEQAQPASTAEEIDNTLTSSNNDQITNEVRESGEANDSFEDSIPPGEIIVVNDDATPTENDQLQETANVPK